MVRFALFLGASLVATFFLLRMPSLPHAPEIRFEREAITTTPVSLSTSSIPGESDIRVQDPVDTVSPKKAESLPMEETPPAIEAPNSDSSSTSIEAPAVLEEVRAPSLSPDILNEKARSALVNILCEANAPLRSTSGSGVIIDPRGIILTNAHIAQHFLLEKSSLVSCTVRSGSPATARWRAKLVFIPEEWVKKHASDILSTRATGTGEHDYAFLVVTEVIDNSPLPSFPFIPLDAKEATSVTGDPVLIAGYPAEFVGGSAARSALYASTVFSNIKQLLTFTEDIIDVISVGGTVLAQSGSSGGGFIDLYGSLVGLIVTTSIGDTTGSRDLHAITPAHIDRSIQQHTGSRLETLLSKSTSNLLQEFSTQYDAFAQTLINAIDLQRN